MGDPRKLRKKYSKPSHPWQKERIDEEKALIAEYGFKNKQEIWKINSKLRNFKKQVKELVPKTDELSEKRKQALLAKLHKLNLVKENAALEDILGLTLKDICGRRLQTVVYKKGLTRSVRQARQFITHEHIKIGDKKITSPNYLVNSDEEALIQFASNSSMHSEDHPERLPMDAVVKEERKKIEDPKLKPKSDSKEIPESKEIPISEVEEEIDLDQVEKEIEKTAEPAVKEVAPENVEEKVKISPNPAVEEAREEIEKKLEDKK